MFPFLCSFPTSSTKRTIAAQISVFWTSSMYDLLMALSILSLVHVRLLLQAIHFLRSVLSILHVWSLNSIFWLQICSVFPSLINTYKIIPKPYRKNIKYLYAYPCLCFIHRCLWKPTIYANAVVYVFKPFISSKFYKKIIYLQSYQEVIVCVLQRQKSL